VRSDDWIGDNCGGPQSWQGIRSATLPYDPVSALDDFDNVSWPPELFRLNKIIPFPLGINSSNLSSIISEHVYYVPAY